MDRWIDVELRPMVLGAIDGEGYVRGEDWAAGETPNPPAGDLARVTHIPKLQASATLAAILDKAVAGKALSESEIVRSRADQFRQIRENSDAETGTEPDLLAAGISRTNSLTNLEPAYFTAAFTFTEFSSAITRILITDKLAADIL